MIKAILFDIGGVIIDLDSLVQETMKIVKPRDPGKFWHDFNHSFIPACKGLHSIRYEWNHVSHMMDFGDDKDRLYQLWIDDFHKYIIVNEQVEKIIKELHGRYKLGVISNIIKEHAQQVRGLEVFSYFNEVIFSNEVHLTKEGKEVFLLACDRLHVKPEECIFIDDISTFADTARSVGMVGIQFKTASGLAQALKVYGVL
jgi:HAD superfamily hydrolase (TIGR01509 family)